MPNNTCGSSLTHSVKDKFQGFPACLKKPKDPEKKIFFYQGAANNTFLIFVKHIISN